VSDVLKTGLGLLAGAVVFSGFYYWNLRAGNATVWGGVSADRHKNPIGFWFVQFWLGAIAAMALLCAILVLLRITPP
jgi:hypothetical protein